jgi:hypothetical protein
MKRATMHCLVEMANTNKRLQKLNTILLMIFKKLKAPCKADLEWHYLLLVL